MLKGKDVIDSYVFKDEDMSASGFPNQNLIVGWVLRTVAIPNINPHQIMKTTHALTKQAITNKEEKKVIAPISEAKEVELEKVPESEMKRPAATGWVKEEGMKSSQELEDEKRQAFQERMKYVKEEKRAQASQQAPSTLKTTKSLPPIPKGEGVEYVTPDNSTTGSSTFCPHCGKDLDWKFCPYCGKPLPH
ncbi:MAG TPA: zinc ribbon domain-containing protein [Candidatus Nanopelagicaceae bacterium]|nr:zinc ribbon domain-containing protein [Candidatus Nanopelagicaceae bacterium]